MPEIQFLFLTLVTVIIELMILYFNYYVILFQTYRAEVSLRVQV